MISNSERKKNSSLLDIGGFIFQIQIIISPIIIWHVNYVEGAWLWHVYFKKFWYGEKANEIFQLDKFTFIIITRIPASQKM